MPPAACLPTPALELGHTSALGNAFYFSDRVPERMDERSCCCEKKADGYVQKNDKSKEKRRNQLHKHTLNFFLPPLLPVLLLLPARVELDCFGSLRSSGGAPIGSHLAEEFGRWVPGGGMTKVIIGKEKIMSRQQKK